MKWYRRTGGGGGWESLLVNKSQLSQGREVWSLILDEKVNAHLPYYSTLKKFWNGFFQTFQAGLLFFSGGKKKEGQGSELMKKLSG